MVDGTMSSLRSLLSWNEKSIQLFAEEGDPLGPMGCVGLFLMVAVLCAATVLVFSDVIGVGPRVYSGLIAGDFLVNPLLGSSAIAALALYAVDLDSWSYERVAFSILVVLYIFAAGFLCMTGWYPECALIVVAIHHPFVMGLGRLVTAGRITAYSYHTVLGTCSLLASVILLSVWAAWSHLLSDGWDSNARYALKERLTAAHGLYGLGSWGECELERGLPPARRDKAVIKSCSRAELCVFLIWSCPLLEVGLLFCIALFTWIRAWHIKKSKTIGDDASFAQRLVFFFFVLIVIAWVACAVGGANMGLSFTVLRGLAVLVIVFFVWVIHAVPLRSSILNTTNSMVWRLLAPIRSSDWMKAACLCFGGLFLTAFFIADVLAAIGKRLLCCRIESDSPFLTNRGESMVRFLGNWHWGSVLSKTAICGFALTLVFVATPRGCVLFLAWLTNTIRGFELWLVTVVYFFAGLLMFAFPPMPGLAVYMGAGTILVAQTRTAGWGFWQGVAFASGLSFVIKMVSVVMQYLFGEVMARNPKIQRMIGVHTVSTMALTRILNDPGLQLDKAAILCGGPDWPTVVLCGILRVGIGRTLVGELPNVFVVVPYAYAGACWLEDHLMDISNITVMVMCLLQNFSFLIALLLAASEATGYRADMQRSRSEHNDLHQEDNIARDMSRHHKSLTEWHMLSITQRVMLIVAAIAECCGFWAALLLTTMCFRDFSLARRIDDSFEDGGLEGNIFNVFLPYGWGALGAFFGGMLCILLYYIETRIRIQSMGEAGVYVPTDEAMRSSVGAKRSRLSGSIPNMIRRSLSRSSQGPRLAPKSSLGTEGEFADAEAAGGATPRTSEGAPTSEGVSEATNYRSEGAGSNVSVVPDEGEHQRRAEGFNAAVVEI